MFWEKWFETSEEKAKKQADEAARKVAIAQKHKAVWETHLVRSATTKSYIKKEVLVASFKGYVVGKRVQENFYRTIFKVSAKIPEFGYAEIEVNYPIYCVATTGSFMSFEMYSDDKGETWAPTCRMFFK